MRHLRWLTLCLLAPVMAGAAVGIDGLNAELERLQTNGLWAEATLADGRIRPIFVESLSGDSVTVREVIGPLQERQAVYALSELSDLRELGVHRVPLRRALYQPQKSTVSALVLEAVIPGAGYLYIGETRQGLALIGLAAAAVGTGVATGEDGAAGWVPISTWIKIASLFHLRDQVRAMNQAAADRKGLARGSLPDIEIGMLQAARGAVPALRLRTTF